MTGSAIQHTGKANSKIVYRKIMTFPWEKWFAWYPVKVHNNRVWLQTVYRRSIISYVDMDDWQRYEYGTLFDVIKE